MKCDLLGVTVTPLSIEEIKEIIYNCILEKRQCIFGHHNMHSIYLYHRLEKMRYFYELADYITIDGMPIIWVARCLGYQLNRRHRVTFTEIYHYLEFVSAYNLKIFYLGGRPEVVQKGIQEAKKMYPNVQLDAAHGYFDATTGSRENTEVINKINAYQPDILFVGMGMPRQEYWIADNYDKLDAGVIFTSGGVADYFAGVVTFPPRWMGKLGLYGLYRFFSEPRRLWKRYLIEPWFILFLFIKDLLRYKLRLGKG